MYSRLTSSSNFILSICLRTSKDSSMEEFDNVKLYRIFDSIHMHFSRILCIFLLYYAGVGVLFQVLVNAELTCEKEIKKREEMKKSWRKEEKGWNCMFWACGVRHTPLSRHPKFKYHGVRHGPVTFATGTQCRFSATPQTWSRTPLKSLNHFYTILGWFQPHLPV